MFPCEAKRKIYICPRCLYDVHYYNNDNPHILHPLVTVKLSLPLNFADFAP